MNILALEASTECASVALVTEHRISTLERYGHREHAEFILIMVNDLLATNDLKLSDLDAIAFGRGPGSFTGLRITCSIAKGLAYAHNLLLLPVSSLAAIACEALKSPDPPVHDHYSTPHALIMVDACMRQVYWGYFPHRFALATEAVSNPNDICLKDLSKNINGNSPLSTINKPPLILAGVGHEIYQDQLTNHIKERIIKSLTIYPKATAILTLIQNINIAAESITGAVPIYLRDHIV